MSSVTKVAPYLFCRTMIPVRKTDGDKPGKNIFLRGYLKVVAGCFGIELPKDVRVRKNFRATDGGAPPRALISLRDEDPRLVRQLSLNSLISEALPKGVTISKLLSNRFFFDKIKPDNLKSLFFIASGDQVDLLKVMSSAARERLVATFDQNDCHYLVCRTTELPAIFLALNGSQRSFYLKVKETGGLKLAGNLITFMTEKKSLAALKKAVLPKEFLEIFKGYVKDAKSAAFFVGEYLAYLGQEDFLVLIPHFTGLLSEEKNQEVVKLLKTMFNRTNAETKRKLFKDLFFGSAQGRPVFLKLMKTLDESAINAWRAVLTQSDLNAGYRLNCKDFNEPVGLWPYLIKKKLIAPDGTRLITNIREPASLEFSRTFVDQQDRVFEALTKMPVTDLWQLVEQVE